MEIYVAVMSVLAVLVLLSSVIGEMETPACAGPGSMRRDPSFEDGT